ncbi:MAG: Amidohydrolase family protein [Gemmatimonadetes bacterium]|nr:Amidohydrolase family protein [Gemmatimonadota bacterium]
MMRTTAPAIALLALTAACASTNVASREAPAPPARDSVRYEILLGGHAGSFGAEWRDAEGTLRGVEEIHDRGRGPRRRTATRFDSTGLRAIEVREEGRDIWGNPVNSTRRIVGDTLYWQRGADSGRVAIARDVSLAGWLPSAGETGFWVRVLRGRDSLRIAPWIVPMVISARPVATDTLRTLHGDVPLTLWRLESHERPLGRAWLDRDRRFVAEVDAQSTFRSGLQSFERQLYATQERLIAPRRAALATQLAQKSDSGLAIIHARLIDVEAGTSAPGATVIIRGNRIAEIGNDGSVPIPVGARVIDAAGKSLMPGLWEMHGHYGGQSDAGRFKLAAGITSQRDLVTLSADPFDIVARARRIRSGREVGPRVINAGGFIDGTGYYGGPSTVLVDSAAQAVRWVNAYADSGFVNIKLYSSFPVAFVAPTIAAAHARGLRVSGHVPSGLRAEQAVRLGFDELNHMNFVMLNFLGGDTIDTRGTGRFMPVAERGATVNVEGPAVRDFIALLVQKHVAVDPTLCVFESQFTSARGLPATSDAQRARYRGAFETMARLTLALHRAGVRLVAGTDNSCALARELELYVQYGMRPAEALRIATLGAAEYATLQKELGSIAVGKLADLVLVEGNPLEKIADVRNVRLVIKDGAVYDPPALTRAVLDWP